MNKELILKAVQAVMDFNELESQYMASIQVSPYSTWIYIMDSYNECQYVLNIHSATETDITDFIEKLDELKAV